ncbi:MAG: hypothetical protein SFX74_03570 [Fimbriimonadaceae bacterium]|nr:hypothetical protein [Fimbriimonadaceae bacterium]
MREQILTVTVPVWVISATVAIWSSPKFLSATHAGRDWLHRKVRIFGPYTTDLGAKIEDDIRTFRLVHRASRMIAMVLTIVLILLKLVR